MQGFGIQGLSTSVKIGDKKGFQKITYSYNVFHYIMLFYMVVRDIIQIIITDISVLKQWALKGLLII